MSILNLLIPNEQLFWSTRSTHQVLSEMIKRRLFSWLKCCYSGAIFFFGKRRLIEKQKNKWDFTSFGAGRAFWVKKNKPEIIVHWTWEEIWNLLLEKKNLGMNDRYKHMPFFCTFFSFFSFLFFFFLHSFSLSFSSTSIWPLLQQMLTWNLYLKWFVKEMKVWCGIVSEVIV